MNRFNELQKKAASAAAALAISALFVGAAIGPAVNAGNAPDYAKANVAQAAA